MDYGNRRAVEAEEEAPHTHRSELLPYMALLETALGYPDVYRQKLGFRGVPTLYPVGPWGSKGSPAGLCTRVLWMNEVLFPVGGRPWQSGPFSLALRCGARVSVGCVVPHHSPAPHLVLLLSGKPTASSGELSFSDFDL